MPGNASNGAFLIGSFGVRENTYDLPEAALAVARAVSGAPTDIAHPLPWRTSLKKYGATIGGD